MWPEQGTAVEAQWMHGRVGCILLVLCGLSIESVDYIWDLFPVVLAAGSSMEVHYAASSFQAACVFSGVGGDPVYKCANAAHRITGSLQEIVQPLVI